MKCSVMTLFPEMFDVFFRTSILGRAVEAKKIDASCYQIRDYVVEKHRRVDDYPYGGGAGMVIQAAPLTTCLKAIEGWSEAKRIYMSPRGSVLTHEKAMALAKEPHLIFICGHYEGIDQRFIDAYVDEELSIGDYVLTGGELAAMVAIDSIARLQGDVLGNDTSHLDESHANGLLEYPHYTRPESYDSKEVPLVLRSGNHEAIDLWRLEESLKLTHERRPDLLLNHLKTINLKKLPTKKKRLIYQQYAEFTREGQFIKMR